MFDHIVLEAPQKELLSEVVEAERSLPQEKRGRFLVARSLGNPLDTFIHTGGPRLTGHLEDVEILSSYGLVTMGSGSRGTPNFYVTPFGFQYYEYVKRLGAPAEAVEDEIRRHVSSEQFQRGHPRSFAKWAQAENLLWSNNSSEQLTTVGHLCREAMQEFAEELLQTCAIPDPHPPKTNTVARVRAVIAARTPTVGSTVGACLDALVPYWGTVADLAQRQEHGGQRESNDLLWEDARRLVFQTLVVFVEIQRALSRTAR